MCQLHIEIHAAGGMNVPHTEDTVAMLHASTKLRQAAGTRTVIGQADPNYEMLAPNELTLSNHKAEMPPFAACPSQLPAVGPTARSTTKRARQGVTNFLYIAREAFL